MRDSCHPSLYMRMSALNSTPTCHGGLGRGRLVRTHASREGASYTRSLRPHALVA
jgi:hypothetical protein